MIPVANQLRLEVDFLNTLVCLEHGIYKLRNVVCVSSYLTLTRRLVWQTQANVAEGEHLSIAR